MNKMVEIKKIKFTKHNQYFPKSGGKKFETLFNG
jgi:hypothetical protein